MNLNSRNFSLVMLLSICLSAPAFSQGKAEVKAEAEVAEEENVAPTINQYYEMDPDFDNWQYMFESDGREVYDMRFKIIEKLGIKPGLRIADVGAGTGLFTMLFAQEVGPTGQVYAVDIAEEFVSNIARRAKREGFNNVKAVLNNPKTVNLAANSVDMVFLSDTYHHFEYPITTLKTIYTALDKEGMLVITDFIKRRNFSSSWVMGHVRANKEQVIKEVESIGFKVLESSHLKNTNYYLSFKKISKAQ